jgi:hypothetical protein
MNGIILSDVQIAKSDPKLKANGNNLIALELSIFAGR